MTLQTVFDAIGTAAAPATLTGEFSGNQYTFSIRGVSKITFEIGFTPGASKRTLEMQLQTSSDDRTNFAREETSETSGVDSRELWIVPIKFTGASGGTVYRFTHKQEVNSFDMRISIREVATSGFGTSNIRVVLWHGD